MYNMVFCCDAVGSREERTFDLGNYRIVICGHCKPRILAALGVKEQDHAK